MFDSQQIDSQIRKPSRTTSLDPAGIRAIFLLAFKASKLLYRRIPVVWAALDQLASSIPQRFC